MFFIQRGNVAILEEDDETVSKVLGPGQHFGEVQALKKFYFYGCWISVSNVLQ